MERLKLNFYSEFEYDKEDVIKSNENVTVIKAFDTHLKRYVCIKKVHYDPKHYNVALNEVIAMQKYSEKTPYVPHVYFYTVDKKENNIYIVMEWIKGMTLTHKMSETLLLENFVKYMIQLCDILMCFEKCNESHKDIKPDNILIDENNRVHLIDFNITYSLTNMVEGTAHYKAPEMSNNIIKCVDRSKVDQFSIGVMLYEFSTRTLPKYMDKYSVNKRSLQNREWSNFCEPKNLNPNISDDLNKIICTCMKLNPQERYRSLFQLKRDLERLRYGKRKSK